MPAAFGLPDSIRACLFDLDGVLTRTATVHFAAWKRTFDEFLRAHDPRAGEFTQADYNAYVDGRHRADGVRGFLASRGIVLPEGAPGDPSDAATVQAIATRKNELVLRELEEHGVEVYEGSVRYLRAVKEAGLATAVVTASANGAQVIAAGGVRRPHRRPHRRGGRGARRPARQAGAGHVHRRGAGARRPAVTEAVVYEDALSGVAAGRAGGFGFVVGVDRVGQAAALEEMGADVVVQDLSELLEDRS